MNHSARLHNVRQGEKNTRSWKEMNWKKNSQNINLNSKSQTINFKKDMGGRHVDQLASEEIPPKKIRLHQSSRLRTPGVSPREAVDEIRDGLQLWVRYGAIQTDRAESFFRKLRGLHSFERREIGDRSCTGVMLFTDVESLEAAKVSMEKNSMIEEVDYMGVRSTTDKITTEKGNPKIRLHFNYIADEEIVRSICKGIVRVERVPQNESTRQSCFIAEFSSSSCVQQVIAALQESVGHNGLREVCEYVPMTGQQKVLSKRRLKLVVLRDVPKSATMHDIAAVFPNAVGIRLFRQTFPASNYCHAILLFDEISAASKAVKKAQNTRLLGKRLYAFPFHHSLMRDLPDLGKEKSHQLSGRNK